MRSDFAVFIMVYGRPDKMWTRHTLINAGYTGKIYYVGDDTDEQIEKYRKKYKDDLIVFSKMEVAKNMDAGDNTNDYRSTLYAANAMFQIAKDKGVKYFMTMCDDYTSISYRFDSSIHFVNSQLKSLDFVLDKLINYFESVNAKTIAFAQGGDFVGGREGTNAHITLLRKAMNTFLCSVDRPFKFMGRLNEDVTTYVNLGSKGELFLTITQVAINQKQHQSEKGGLTDVYLAYGTYVKSFFSVMYNPSSVIISVIGQHKRIHHKVKWNNAVPKILREELKKRDG